MRGGKADIQERGASIASVADDPSFATGHTKCMKKPLEIVLAKSQQNAPFWTPNLAYGKQAVFGYGCGTLSGSRRERLSDETRRSLPSRLDLGSNDRQPGARTAG